MLTFGNDGNLVVVDGNRRSIWSTNSSTVAGNNATGFLLDSGNLILAVNEVSDPDKALWQSFEDPTDTYLPGMRIWLNPRSKKNLFVSWKSESDPSQGKFSMGIPPLGLMEIMAWEGSERRWRSGQWNQQIFIGVPRMTAANYLYGYRVSDIGGRTFFTYIVYNSSELFRYQITWDGIVEQLRWNAVRREWAIFWAEPTRPCEHYNTCGPFGSCRAWSSPICSCLRGFEPKSKTEWDSGNWTSGCVRKTQLQCDRNASSGQQGGVDQFLELDGQKLPDFSVLIPSIDMNDCRDICLRNCSCKAYAYPNGIQCLTWSGDFLDVQQFRQGGEKLYIRLAASELGKF
ncbi:non-specific serine/threonine protein kinase [Ranunculus cassubicifolius]